MKSDRYYDYWLVGSTGQIGRYLLPELQNKGTVSVADPRKDDFPVAEHIVNAAGCTKLGLPDVNEYWNNNILLAVKLARYASHIGASFHQLSSVAVAEFKSRVLRESDEPIPDERQLPYSMSKVLVELATRAVNPYTVIYRVGDVVPPLEDMSKNWRRNHWLSVLFSQGKAGFDLFPEDYGVWLSETKELAHSIRLLLHRSSPTYHVLGCRYNISELREAALPVFLPSQPVIQWMTEIVLHGPEASMVDNDGETPGLLRLDNFKYTRLDKHYWEEFAKSSVWKASHGRRNAS
jgi:nucleoside-diphosphate-sugar epimerase